MSRESAKYWIEMIFYSNHLSLWATLQTVQKGFNSTAASANQNYFKKNEKGVLLMRYCT